MQRAMGVHKLLKNGFKANLGRKFGILLYPEVVLTLIRGHLTFTKLGFFPCTLVEFVLTTFFNVLLLCDRCPINLWFILDCALLRLDFCWAYTALQEKKIKCMN